MAQLDGKLLPTTVVGSYPQPDWLFDRSTFALRSVPRVRTPDVWRMSGVLLEQAQDDATILAIRAMECAGVDIVTDGEIRREGMSNRFATALEGVDGKRPAKVPSFVPGQTQDALRVVGPVRRSRPVMVYDAAFLRANTRHLAKMTLPGPFSLSQEVVNEYYDDDETLALDYATAVRAELIDIAAAGVDVIQLDEPWLQNRPDAAKRFGVKAINAALRGISATTALHLCFGYGWRRPAQAKYTAYAFFEELGDCAVQQVSIETVQANLDLGFLTKLPNKTIILGVIDLNTPGVETPETVAARIRAGLRFVGPERLIVAPDCGMKYIDRNIAFAKLQSLCGGADIVRAELTGETKAR